MGVEHISVLTVAFPVGVVLVGVILVALPRFWQRIAQGEWGKLQNKVDQIVAEMDSADAPKPTHQMCQFLVAGEDRRFHHHPGVDPIAMCRAVWKTIFCGQRQGGSTIAMQFVRTVTGRYEIACRRKLSEMILAVRVTRHIGRARLPALYLWVAYYGWQMNSFRQACLRGHIDPSSASELKSAMLVARLKYPEPQILSLEHKRKIQRRADHLMSLKDAGENNRRWNHLAFRTH